MDELLQAIMKEAMAETIKNKNKMNEPENMLLKAKKIAETNKALFDAHVKAGFTIEQALKIVLVIID